MTATLDAALERQEFTANGRARAKLLRLSSCSWQLHNRWGAIVVLEGTEHVPTRIQLFAMGAVEVWGAVPGAAGWFELLEERPHVHQVASVAERQEG